MSFLEGILKNVSAVFVPFNESQWGLKPHWTPLTFIVCTETLRHFYCSTIEMNAGLERHEGEWMILYHWTVVTALCPVIPVQCLFQMSSPRRPGQTSCEMANWGSCQGWHWEGTYLPFIPFRTPLCVQTNRAAPSAWYAAGPYHTLQHCLWGSVQSLWSGV